MSNIPVSKDAMLAPALGGPVAYHPPAICY
jgi:hypothetical protein